MKPHIVVGGGLHPDGLKLMEAEARVTLVSDSETEAGMVAVAKDAAGILFRSKPLCSRSLMAALPNLKVIGRHGVGLDIVDLPAASDLGIAVVHAPGSNSQAVAEHAVHAEPSADGHTRVVGGELLGPDIARVAEERLERGDLHDA